MRGPGALAATAVVASETYRSQAHRHAVAAWTLFALAALAFIGAAWWEALS